MKISLYQFLPQSNMHSNVEKVLDAMGRAAAQGADLFLTTEVCLSTFFPQYPGRDATGYALNIDDEIVKAFQAACRRLKLAASPNIYLREGGKYYDASLYIDANGELLGISKMVHICQAPCFYEQDYYAPSDTGFKVFDTAMGKIGIVICYDRHFPESIRTCALKGAQLILVPTVNTSSEPRDLYEWELRVAAMQNNVFIACCNRVGVEDAMDFYGESFVIGPDGNIVAKAGGSEQLLIADVDLSLVGTARKKRPFLDLLRPDAYES
jgi:predicted amidohydrolase